MISLRETVRTNTLIGESRSVLDVDVAKVISSETWAGEGKEGKGIWEKL